MIVTGSKERTLPLTAQSLSLDEIASTYGRMVSSVCRRMIRDDELARDAAQHVWLEVVKSLPSFRNESKLSTWLYTITRRIAADFAKNEQTYSMRFVRDYFDSGEVEPPVQPDLDKKLWVKQMCDQCVTAMLHCVDNETRLAHIFRDIAELEYEDIAGILEKEEPAVRQMVARSRKRINSFLKDRCSLYNPAGDCTCRIKKTVDEVDLAAEYAKIYALVKRVNFYQASETVLPNKDYWKNLI